MNDNIFVSLIILIIALFLIGSLIQLGYSHGYEAGQVDYANNQIYYQLVDQDDGSRSWVECESICE